MCKIGHYLTLTEHKYHERLAYICIFTFVTTMFCYSTKCIWVERFMYLVTIMLYTKASGMKALTVPQIMIKTSKYNKE